MYPRHRLDGLGDTIYGVSMTLLVLDIRIPNTVQVVDSAGFAALMRTLWPHVLPYLISFVVLSSGWLSAIRVTPGNATSTPAYVRWWRPQLLLVTAMPFTTMTVARFSSVPLAVSLYAANIGLMSLCAWGMLAATEAENETALAGRRALLVRLIALSLLAITFSRWLGAWALLSYFLTRFPLRRFWPAPPIWMPGVTVPEGLLRPGLIWPLAVPGTRRSGR